MVLSAGNCYACGELGDVLFLVALHDESVFVACNMCEGASRAFDKDPRWLHQHIREYAPSGFRPATKLEVAAIGYDLRRVRVVARSQFDMLIS